MNRYGATAQKHWQQFLPQAYTQIRDPQTYFSDLGEQIEDQVIELMWALAGDDPPGEGYLKKVGRLNMARLQAEERVLAEMLPEPENADTDEPQAALA